MLWALSSTIWARRQVTTDPELRRTLVAKAIRRQLPPGSDPSALVFTGPGGGPGRPGDAGVPKGARTVLSRHNFHRTYHAALAKLADPTGELRP
jgi:hypothetical protein